MKNRPLFIGPESDLFIVLSLTHSRLVNLIDATLACENANSKLVEVVTDLGAEVWVIKLNFGSDFEHKVWSGFEVEIQARF